MERKLRASAAGFPEHVIQRGNDRQEVFCNEDDIIAGRLALFDTDPFIPHKNAKLCTLHNT